MTIDLANQESHLTKNKSNQIFTDGKEILYLFLRNRCRNRLREALWN